mmetsp:Transcript_24059/g.59682  ORF Transcript_24059/g.59682 Transcript_24059/m.59682 type:complete len:260 (-) Transcript_24059:44-823(-)
MRGEGAAVARSRPPVALAQSIDKGTFTGILRAHHPHLLPFVQQLLQLLGQDVDAHPRSGRHQVDARRARKPVRLRASPRKGRHARASTLRRKEVYLGGHKEHIHALVHHVWVQHVYCVHWERPVEVHNVHQQQDDGTAGSHRPQPVAHDAAKVERRHEDLRRLILHPSVVPQAVAPRARHRGGGVGTLGSARLPAHGRLVLHVVVAEERAERGECGGLAHVSAATAAQHVIAHNVHVVVHVRYILRVVIKVEAVVEVCG